MKTIKLYANPHHRVPELELTQVLFPLWGIPQWRSKPYRRAAAQQQALDKDSFQFVDDIANADFVVVPHLYRAMKRADSGMLDAVVAQARAAGKMLLIDATGDLDGAVPLQDAVVMRIGQYRYGVADNEITVPCLTEDLLLSYRGGIFSPRRKSSRPSVGFAGFASLSVLQRLRVALKELPISLASLGNSRRVVEHKGVLWRQRALAALRRCGQIDARMLVRTSYSGNIKTVAGSLEENRREFIDNLDSSDYALVVRGDANASYRFYEALSMGRIPLFLDTACVLPLEDIIDYRSFCVFVDHTDVERIGDILAEFHAKISLERFIEMQRMARAAFEHHLRFDAFSRHLAEDLSHRLGERVQ